MKPITSVPLTDLQLDSQNRLRHLITLDGLDHHLLTTLLDHADAMLTTPESLQHLSGCTVANLFFEHSTRTRVSFELAAKRLGATVVNLDIANSSVIKGESLIDTLHTLLAMDIDMFVVRHGNSGVAALLAQAAGQSAGIINAGESHLSHPTQGLLDALTIRQHKPELTGLAVVIIGDVLHSRVARSALHALRILGVEDLRLAGPKNWMPNPEENLPATYFANTDEAINGADVVMMLRIQKERMHSADMPDNKSYFERYGLTAARLALARTDAIVMHPGPINRGIEIDSAIADGPQSVIRQQVRNGVAIRMAVMSMIRQALP